MTQRPLRGKVQHRTGLPTLRVGYMAGTNDAAPPSGATTTITFQGINGKNLRYDGHDIFFFDGLVCKWHVNPICSSGLWRQRRFGGILRKQDDSRKKLRTRTEKQKRRSWNGDGENWEGRQTMKGIWWREGTESDQEGKVQIEQRPKRGRRAYVVRFTSYVLYWCDFICYYDRLYEVFRPAGVT